MSDLPKNWGHAPFHQVAEVTDFVANGSFASLKENVTYLTDGYGVLVRLTDWKKNWTRDFVYVSKDAYAFLSKSELHPGDIVISCVGEPGQVFQVPDLGRPMTLGPNSVRIRELPDALVKRFFAYYWKSPIGQEQLAAITTGTTQLKFNKTGLRSSSVRIAPLQEQKRIADKLDTVLTRVDAVNTRLARVAPILKRFRQSILAGATSGRLTQDWRPMTDLPPMTEQVLTATRLRAGCSMKDARITGELIERGCHLSPNELIPTTWICTCIGMVGIVSNGSTPSRSEPSYWGGSIPWVSSGEVRNNRIGVTKERISQLGFTSSSVKLLPAGSVLIAMIGEGKTRGQSGLLDIAATINQNIAAVVPNEALIEPEYLWYWFQSQYEANRVAGNGTGPQALNCQKVRELNLNLPPLQEQREIVRRVETLFAFADRLEARLQTAQTATNRLTPALLAKAFRGELVPQDPNDEPASELLQRLAASANAAPAKKRGRPARTT